MEHSGISLLTFWNSLSSRTSSVDCSVVFITVFSKYQSGMFEQGVFFNLNLSQGQLLGLQALMNSWTYEDSGNWPLLVYSVDTNQCSEPNTPSWLWFSVCFLLYWSLFSRLKLLSSQLCFVTTTSSCPMHPSPQFWISYYSSIKVFMLFVQLNHIKFFF